jgi:hypothetical protein
MNLLICYIHFIPNLRNFIKYLIFAHFLSILPQVLIEFRHVREISWLIGRAEVLNAWTKSIVGMFSTDELLIIDWWIKSLSLKEMWLVHLISRLTMWGNIRNLTVVIWKSKSLEDRVLLQKVLSKSLWW